MIRFQVLVRDVRSGWFMVDLENLLMLIGVVPVTNKRTRGVSQSATPPFPLDCGYDVALYLLACWECSKNTLVEQDCCVLGEVVTSSTHVKGSLWVCTVTDQERVLR